MSFHAPQHYMTRHPVLGTGEGNNGLFVFERDGIQFTCVASDGEGWEHVSVSLNKKRCPTWDEMCAIKNLFWDEDDCVVQFHPSKNEYVNLHPYCLHLWRPTTGSLNTPPKWLIG